MNEHELQELLRSVDDENGGVTPDFADRLWTDVRATLQRTNEGGAELVPVEPEPIAARSLRRPTAWLAMAAATVLLLIVGIAVVADRLDEPAVSTQPPTTTAPDLDTLPTTADACTELVDERDQLVVAARDLSTTADVDLDAVAADLDQTLDRLSELERILRIRGATGLADDARRFAGGIRQARDELLAGERDRAVSSLERSVGFVDGDRCADPGV